MKVNSFAAILLTIAISFPVIVNAQTSQELALEMAKPAMEKVFPLMKMAVEGELGKLLAENRKKAQPSTSMPIFVEEFVAALNKEFVTKVIADAYVQGMTLEELKELSAMLKSKVAVKSDAIGESLKDGVAIRAVIPSVCVRTRSRLEAINQPLDAEFRKSCP
jgi:hypothetical protein